MRCRRYLGTLCLRKSIELSGAVGWEIIDVIPKMIIAVSAGDNRRINNSRIVCYVDGL